MYSKNEASAIKQEFWTSFGQYIAPVLSYENEKINWVNYKTGDKNIRFIMDADHQSAKISILLSHKDLQEQQICYEKLLGFKKSLEKSTGEEWIWLAEISNAHDRIVSEVSKKLDKVSIFNKEHWPLIISFLKPRILALDEFWCEYKHAFLP